MKNNFDIGITTFSLRLDMVSDMVKKIREFGVDNNILICVNGEKDGNFDEEYRKNILNLCLEYKNVFPIFFVEIRGLSKMWNSLLIHSVKDDILLLSDDVVLYNSNMFDVVSEHIESNDYFGISKINGTFAHVVVNKKFIDDLGYFDERLLGFGEEDGDITYRTISKTGKDVYQLYVGGSNHLVSEIRHEFVKRGVGKYSFFNRNFMFNEKYKCGNSTSKISGMFGVDCDPILENKNLYPYESFFMENKNNL